MERRSILQIGDLDAELTASEQGSFAGLWIQHQPELRVIVQFTDRAGVAFNSDVNVFDNRVELHVVEPEKLQAKLAAAGAHLPEGVLVKRVPRLAQTEALIGGVPLTTCTGGFTVRNSSTGELGISTAAHCGNTQAYQGVNLPFRLEDNNGDQDVQWHSACDIFDVTNQFDSGIGIHAGGSGPLRSGDHGGNALPFAVRRRRSAGRAAARAAMARVL